MKDEIELRNVKENKLYKISKIAFIGSIIVSVLAVLEMILVYFITSLVLKDQIKTSNERAAKLKELTSTPISIGAAILIVFIILTIAIAIFKKYQERKALKYEYQLKDAIEQKENLFD